MITEFHQAQLFGSPMPKAIRNRAPAKPRSARQASTVAEYLEPVGRQHFGANRVTVRALVTMRDGSSYPLTIGRSPKDSDAVAIEVARRLAVLFQANSRFRLAPREALQWHDVSGRHILSYPAAIIESAVRDVAHVRAVPPALSTKTRNRNPDRRSRA